MYSFKATWRCSATSHARYTMPKPPAPITARISNSANRVPGDSASPWSSGKGPASDRTFGISDMAARSVQQPGITAQRQTLHDSGRAGICVVLRVAGACDDPGMLRELDGVAHRIEQDLPPPQGVIGQ